MSYLNTIRFSESSLDTFNRLRVSTPKTIFDTKQLGDNLPLQWSDTQVSGTATSTYTLNRASTKLGVTGNVAGRRTRQTKRRFNYQPGKSPLIFMTGIVGNIGTGITKRLGLFDNNNGIFFEFNSSGAFVVVRSFVTGSAVDTKVALAPIPGITLNFTKAQIFVIDYEWLGVGIVRFGFVVDGVLYYTNKIMNANNIDSVYMSTPNLPLRYEIISAGTGTATPSELECICSTVIVEGGEEENGWPGSIARGASPLFVNNASIIPLIAMRLNSGYIGSSVKPSNFTIDPDTTCIYTWYLMLNPIVAGPAFSWTALTNYSIDYDISKTVSTTLSGGTILASGTQRDTVSSGGIDFNFAKDFYLGLDYNNVSDVLVLAVQRHSGTNITYYSSLNFIDQK